MKKFTTYLTATMLIGSGAQANDQNNYVYVMFKNFPEGTTCSVAHAEGVVVRKRSRGEPVVGIVNRTSSGVFFCRLPDGRQITSDVNQRLPDNVSRVELVVYPGGITQGAAFIDGTYKSLTYANTLSF